MSARRTGAGASDAGAGAVVPIRRGPAGEAIGAYERAGNAPLELCGPRDLFHDYVLGGYEPRAPFEGKLRSVNVLTESFALEGVEVEGSRLVNLVRAGLGPFRTVWGIKQDVRTGRLRGWELYFYDFARAHADLSVERVARLMAPALTVDAREARPLPWHMFSVEFTAEDLRAGGAARVPAHVYVDMRSYELRGDALAFENVYTFHDARAEVDDVLHRLRSALHVDARRHNLASLMPPWLFRCHRICVANKRHTDALYFSRVPTASLRRFLATHAWPAGVRAFVDAHADRMDHLLWDVGVDFRYGADAPEVLKTGIYGSF